MPHKQKVVAEEKTRIVRECLYGEMAKKYNVSYQQVRSWTLHYKELGEAGLEDRRGKMGSGNPQQERAGECSHCRKDRENPC